MKHKEHAEHYRVKYCSRHQIPQEAYPPPQTQAPADAWQWQKAFKDRHAFGGMLQETPAAEVPAHLQNKVSEPQRLPEASPLPAFDNWEEERQRLLKIKQQATDSVSSFVCRE